ncbi:MAG TPA: nuclear transport factor 2 family protein [Ktedonobacterales bacterium]
MSDITRQLIERFWHTMNTNDWDAVGRLLCDDCALDYPQSGERFRGRASFAAINAHYPAAGPWRFTVQRIVADGATGASDVQVSAPEMEARVVSFFDIRDGLIASMTEYWPDPFPAAAWRAQWAEQGGGAS